jgi:ABC-2 type transport system ATP-binding protein
MTRAAATAPGPAIPPGAAADSAVLTESLGKTYPGGTAAVADLNLAVRRGEVLGLLGPNGAGKTTTAGMLTTTVRPTSGRAWVAGIDVAAAPARVHRHIGVVPQRNTLDRRLNVRDNLVFHGRYFGMRPAAARTAAGRLLEQVSLAHAAGKRVDELSGGMAQRLMIARAIMHAPEVLFLDEPTTGLDPQSRLAVHDIITGLQAAGQTILLITHDMIEADILADRVAIIDHGRLLALDTPAGLKRSVRAGTVVTVTADGTSPAELAAALAASVPGAREARPLGDTVMLTVGDSQPVLPAVLPAVLAAADTCHARLREVHVDPPTLETVFIQLTGKELRES